MVESGKVRADRFVLMACGAFALVMTALTLGAAAPVGAGIVATFIVLGLAPYAFTAILSLIQPMRRLVVATARAVAVVYGLFDCGLRYLALYHAQRPRSAERSSSSSNDGVSPTVNSLNGVPSTRSPRWK